MIDWTFNGNVVSFGRNGGKFCRALHVGDDITVCDQNKCDSSSNKRPFRFLVTTKDSSLSTEPKRWSILPSLVVGVPNKSIFHFAQVPLFSVSGGKFYSLGLIYCYAHSSPGILLVVVDLRAAVEAKRRGWPELSYAARADWDWFCGWMEIRIWGGWLRYQDWFMATVFNYGQPQKPTVESGFLDCWIELGESR